VSDYMVAMQAAQAAQAAQRTPCANSPMGVLSKYMNCEIDVHAKYLPPQAAVSTAPQYDGQADRYGYHPTYTHYRLQLARR
jgi:hypothetical protein